MAILSNGSHEIFIWLLWPNPCWHKLDTQFIAVCSLQYFGQNSGSRLGDGAIVTKLFVFGAGFFQAVPLGYMLQNAFDQMLIEGPPLEARH